jgi:hypothetical protein
MAISVGRFVQDNTFTFTAPLSKLLIPLVGGKMPKSLQITDLRGDYTTKDFDLESVIDDEGNVVAWRYIERVFWPIARSNRMKLLITNN